MGVDGKGGGGAGGGGEENSIKIGKTIFNL